MREYFEVVREAGDLHSSGKLDQAAVLYENCLGALPDDPVVHFLYGTLYSQRKQFGTAICMLEKATRLEPKDMPEAWHNLGVAYRNEGHSEKAREAYQRALDIDPNRADTLAMMAGTYVNTGDPKKAVEYADRALAIQETGHARNHKALANLELRNWAQGWADYESRFSLDVMSSSKRPYECPRWDGKPVRKLAIHGEQGIGDEILFMSCFGDAVGIAEEIIVECEPRLVSLFERSFGVECFGDHNSLIAAHPDVDAYIPMGSLPGLFRLKDEDFPRHVYLQAEATHKFDGYTIGIAWHGGTKGTHQELRNAPLHLWKELIEANPDKNFISLQYGEDGLMQANQLGIMHFQDQFDTFEDQAGLIKSCDLVISVCQTAIHIAGAMGVPCWCLTPDHAAWRYGVEGDMLWYPESLELIRQNGRGWDGVFEIVGKRLNDINH